MEGEESLTVQHEHLLKRELLRLEMNQEADRIDNMIHMDLLGPPFVLPNGEYADGTEYPLFTYILKYFVVSFPLLKTAKEGFWKDTAQPFIQGLASKDISSSADRDEATKRRRVARVIKRLLLLFFVAGMATNRPKKPGSIANSPAASTIGNLSLKDDEKGDLSVVAPKEPTPPAAQPFAGPYAAVIGVREGSISTFIRNKTQSEYVIECFHNGGSMPVYVARSWADFVQLNKELTLHFPGKRMPHLPRKTLQNTTTVVNGKEKVLLREPQRITLRQYMNRLCQIPRVAHSDVFIDFLFRNQIELNKSEREDIEARIALDKQRQEDRKRFHELTKEREQRLDKYIGEIKNEILLEDALPKLFLEMKTHRKVEDMSPLLQKFVEWCLVNFASLLYDLLIAQDSSPEFFSQVKRFHNLMPYTTMRGILKLSNPALVLKKMTQLFMATPYGRTSLIQQMFIRILSDDMRSQEVLIDELEQRIPDKDLIKTLETYIAEDHYSRVALQQRASDDNIDIVLEIVRTYGKSAARTKEVAAWHSRWQEAVANEQLTEDEDPTVEKYSQLKDLLKLKVRARDKQVMQEFWSDPLTIKFIRELVNVTYDVFIDIFRYAHVSESVGDLQRFMDDLIAYVEYATTEVVLDASQMVDNLLTVLKKHQNSIFKFINRVYSRESGFFVDMVEWMTLFVAFVKRGKEGKSRLDLLSLVGRSKAVDPTKVREELDALQKWLDRRRETAKKGLNLPKGEDFPVAGHFDVTDVGLSWDDIDYGLAEIERDDMEEFVADPWADFTKDQLTLERRRRTKLAELEARKQQLTPRPELHETAKLLPEFKQMLIDVLSAAKLEKSRIKDLEESLSKA